VVAARVTCAFLHAEAFDAAKVVVQHFHGLCFVVGAARFRGRSRSCSGSTLVSVTTGLSGSGGGLIPQQIHNTQRYLF
jgi:hypothetical protein